MKSRRHASSLARASSRDKNQCVFRHSSRSRPLNDSTNALSVGLPGRLAFAANAATQRAKDHSTAEVAKILGYTNNYFTLLLRLATLAPSIVQTIVEGRQPIGLTRQRLAKISNLPIDWTEQRQMLGFQPA